MNPDEQISILAEYSFSNFNEKLKGINKFPLKSDVPSILQINTGKKCNLECKHCHVEAGPNRKEAMSRETLEACLELAKQESIDTIDITGGAPEINIHLKWFIDSVAKLNKRILIRSNLIVLKDKKYQEFIDIYTKYNIELIASLPDLNPEITGRQRGPNTFRQIIEVIQVLNTRGYGYPDTGRALNLVHNPVGTGLSCPQSILEQEYRKKLKQDYNIVFNNLFCLKNMPVGRYLDYLIKTDNLQDYMCALIKSFNLRAVNNVMCKNTISVSWDGLLYDCDFNQMLGLAIKDQNITEINFSRLKNRVIMTNNHCYGCVAGSGSSCQGNTTLE
ncbi:MAG: radical SAM/Cys-rich domain protein [bacterium]|nr:radical SAM/Cys-rich domain protein [bacterium]